MTKYCSYSKCGKELIRKEKEAIQSFDRRKYCGIPCSRSGQRENGNCRNDHICENNKGSRDINNGYRSTR